MDIFFIASCESIPIVDRLRFQLRLSLQLSLNKGVCSYLSVKKKIVYQKQKCSVFLFILFKYVLYQTMALVFQCMVNICLSFCKHIDFETCRRLGVIITAPVIPYLGTSLHQGEGGSSSHEPNADW